MHRSKMSPVRKTPTNRKTSKPKLTPEQRGVVEGYRSGLEGIIAEQILRATGRPAQYEQDVLRYTVPEKVSKYTPDFKLPNGIIVETKGRFVTEDRRKHLLVKAQHPHLDIRFVFSNSKAKIGKKSPTTYAMWCEKNGFKYADRWIPESWFNEEPK